MLSLSCSVLAMITRMIIRLINIYISIAFFFLETTFRLLNFIGLTYDKIVYTSQIRYEGFYKGIKMGSIETIEKCLNEDMKLVRSVYKENGAQLYSPVAYAVLWGQLEAMKLLIDKAADVNGGSIPALHLACYEDINFMRHLIAAGADVEGTHNGLSVMEKVVLMANFDGDKLRLLVESGANVTRRDASGSTVFHKAIGAGVDRALPILLQRINPIDLHKLQFRWSKSRYGILKDRNVTVADNAFVYCCLKSSLSCLKAMLPFIVESEKTQVCNNEYVTMCLLHSIVQSAPLLTWTEEEYIQNQLSMLKLLLDSGFDVNRCQRLTKPSLAPLPTPDPRSTLRSVSPRHSTYSVLEYAVYAKRFDLLPPLLEAGARMGRGLRALCMATVHSHPESCRLLLSYGADPNAMGAKHEYAFSVPVPSALVLPCFRRDGCLFEMLKAGADLDRLPQQIWKELERINSGMYNWIQPMRELFGGRTLNIPAMHLPQDVEHIMTIDNHQFAIGKHVQLLSSGNGMTSLKHLCRVSIVRRILRANNYRPYKFYVDQMAIPTKMKVYLKYGTKKMRRN